MKKNQISIGNEGIKMTKKHQKFTKREKILMYCILSLVLVTTGTTANFQVVSNNHGLMPVHNFPGADYSDEHFNFEDKEEIKYWYFADIIHIWRVYFSIGDVLMFIGLGIALGNVLYSSLSTRSRK